MRAYEVLTEGFRYVGNCTNDHCAKHLEDMMDKAKQITYRTFVQGVGLENVRQVFADYSWGYQRGDIRMKNDPYVYYYKSTYDGVPCYYVRHSGIEYIFVPEEYLDRDDAFGNHDAKPEPQITGNKFSVMPDGALVRDVVGRATFHGEKSPTSITVSISNAPNSKAANMMLRLVRSSKLETITVDGDEEPAADFMKWLRGFI